MTSNLPTALWNIGGRQRFLSALAGQPVDHAPMWLMRQAGRYLPEYRALRGKHGFLDMVRTPELAMEVTLQPLRRFGMDCAILFSDILTVPEAMGIDVRFDEGGPVLAPVVRTAAEVAQLPPADVYNKLGYVADALRLLRTELGDRHALLGFSGAPWTLACYLVEGQGTKSYDKVKTMLYRDPEVMQALLDKLTDAVIDYLVMQVQAGADAVQLFDSWAGELRLEEHQRFVRPGLVRIAQAVRAAGGKLLLFSRHPGHLLSDTLDLPVDALALDHRQDVRQVRQALDAAGQHIALQGNLDPIELFAPASHIVQRVQQIAEQAQGGGWIANLGHGVVPSTPIAGVEAFVQAVRDCGPRRGLVG